MQDEVVKLILDLANSSADVSTLVERLGQLKTKTAEVVETYHLMAVAGEGYSVVTREENREMDEAVRKAVERTQAQRAMNLIIEESIAEQKALAAATAQAGNAATGTANKSAGMGQTMLQTSYAIQDFTSQIGTRGLAGALGAVQNNIPGIVQGMKGSAGLAAGISVVSVAVGILLPELLKLGAALLDSHTKTEAEAMKELEENTSRTADQTDRLNKYKKEQAELQKILIAQSKAQQETQRDMEEFFAESGGKEIIGGLAGTIGASGRGETMTPEEKRDSAPLTEAEEAAMTDDQRMNLALPGGRAEENRKRREAANRAQERINAANAEAAGKIVARAAMGDAGAIATIKAMATANPGAFPKGFAGDLASMDPEAMAKYDAEVAEFDSGNEEYKRRKAARRAKAKKDDAEAKKDDMLNRQGQDLQRAMEKDQDDEMKAGIALGRKAGAAAAAVRAHAKDIDTKGLSHERMELIPPSADFTEAARIMEKNSKGAASDEAHVLGKLIENQSQLSAQQRNIMQMLRRTANDVGAGIQRSRSAASNGGPW